MVRATFSTATLFIRTWRSSWLVLLAMCPMLGGCGGGEKRTKLDSSLVSKYQLKDQDFKQLQYYLAAQLVLTRQVSKEDKQERVKGKLVDRKGEVVEEVVIDKGTPGVCLKSEEKYGSHSLEISFEQGTSLTFSGSTSFIAETDSGGIKFSGSIYKYESSQRNAAYLEVGIESLEKNEKRRKTLGGRKLEP